MMTSIIRYTFRDANNDITSFFFDNNWHTMSRKILVEKKVNIDSISVLKKESKDFDVIIVPKYYTGSKYFITPFNLVCAYVTSKQKQSVIPIELGDEKITYNKTTVVDSIVLFLEHLFSTGFDDIVKYKYNTDPDSTCQENSIPINYPTIIIKTELGFIYKNEIYKRDQSELLNNSVMILSKMTNIKPSKLKLCLTTTIEEYVQTTNDTNDTKKATEKTNNIIFDISGEDIFNNSFLYISPLLLISLCFENGIKLLTNKINEELNKQKTMI